MRVITIQSPRKLVFGRECSKCCADDLKSEDVKRVLLITGPNTRPLASELIAAAPEELILYNRIDREPTIAMFEDALAVARKAHVEAVIGLGGGSVLDVAKLVAALIEEHGSIQNVFGVGRLACRKIFLACIPTTAGTGSEVSPNAILLDETAQVKKGVISPYLVPDATYIDPLLTATMPSHVTAATGLDSLTHCIEAYTNRFAHPVIDLYALEGIRLIGKSLRAAVKNGGDIDAREKMALGSMYGGLCLGPVNTAAVHALAYPLGGRFHVAHGISNAVLLAHVMAFNIPASPERYAEVAVALGAEPRSDALETAREGIQRVKQLISECGIPKSLSEIGIPRDAIPWMAETAIKVTRLIKNNPREIDFENAELIYLNAFDEG